MPSPNLTSSVDASQTSSSSTLTTAALTSNLNDIIVVAISIPDATSEIEVASVTDSAGNTYNLQNRSQQSSPSPGLTSDIWVSQGAAASNTNTITVTLSSAASGWAVNAGSFSGVVAVDVVGSPTYNSGGGNGTVSVAPTKGGELLVGVALSGSQFTTSGLPPGWTDFPGPGVSFYIHSQWFGQGVTCANSLTIDTTSTGPTTYILLAFIPAVRVPGIRTYKQTFKSTGGSASPTVTLGVNQGDSVYVFVSYGGNNAGSLKVNSVKVGTITFNQAGSVKNSSASPYPCQDIWYLDNLNANSSLTITVNFSAATATVITAVAVYGADALNSLDAVSLGSAAGVNPSSDPVTTVAGTDLIIACECASGTSNYLQSDSGFPAVFNKASGTGASDIWSGAYVSGAPRVGTYNVKLDGTSLLGAPVTYALLTVAIRAVDSWATLPGKPYVTVSPVGISCGSVFATNNGADFGPDTPGTTTVGIQEAIDSVTDSGGTVLLLPGTFVPTNTIYIKPNVTLMGSIGYTRPNTPLGTPINTLSIIQPSNGTGGPGWTPTTYNGTAPPTIIGTDSNNPLYPLQGNLMVGFGLANIIVDGTNVSVTVDGIHITNADHAHLESVQVKNCNNGFVFDRYGATVGGLPGQIHCRNLTAAANATAANTAGILIKSHTQVMIQDAQVLSSAYDAVLIQQSSKVVIFGLQVEDYTNAGVHFVDTSNAACTWNSIEQLFCFGGGGAAQDILVNFQNASSTNNQIRGGFLKKPPPNAITITLGGMLTTSFVGLTVSGVEGGSDVGTQIATAILTGTPTVNTAYPNQNPYIVVCYHNNTNNWQITDKFGKIMSFGPVGASPMSFTLAPGESVTYTQAVATGYTFSSRTLE